MTKPIFSKYYILLINNLNLYNGFYWVKIKNLRSFFKNFNGRDFNEQIQDLEKEYERIKPPKELQIEFPEILEEINNIKENIIHQIKKISQSNIKFDELEHFYEYFIRFRRLEKRILDIKSGFQEVDLFKKKIETFKEMYYDIMDNYIRNSVDHHFKNLNFDNLLEFENINFYNYVFTEFENYLFKSFKYILMKRPDIIKKKSIELHQLSMIPENLKIDLINEIVIDNALHDLFYKNYGEIFKYANDPLGLNIEIEKIDVLILNGFKQIKNLYSHGDGTINSLFIKKIQNFGISFSDLGLDDMSLGEKIQIVSFF